MNLAMDGGKMKGEVILKFRLCHEELLSSLGSYSNRATLGPADPRV